jgi:hypothetical protein
LFAKLCDIGIDDARMKAMEDDLAEGEAALFLLVADCHRAHALHEVARFSGRLLASTADEDLVEVVRDRLAADPWAACRPTRLGTVVTGGETGEPADLCRLRCDLGVRHTVLRRVRRGDARGRTVRRRTP